MNIVKLCHVRALVALISGNVNLLNRLAQPVVIN